MPQTEIELTIQYHIRIAHRQNENPNEKKKEILKLTIERMERENKHISHQIIRMHAPKTVTI